MNTHVYYTYTSLNENRRCVWHCSINGTVRNLNTSVLFTWSLKVLSALGLLHFPCGLRYLSLKRLSLLECPNNPHRQLKEASPGNSTPKVTVIKNICPTTQFSSLILGSNAATLPYFNALGFIRCFHSFAAWKSTTSCFWTASWPGNVCRDETAGG